MVRNERAPFRKTRDVGFRLGGNLDGLDCAQDVMMKVIISLNRCTVVSSI